MKEKPVMASQLDRLIKRAEKDDPVRLRSGYVLFQSCCDCLLRHAVTVEIRRGKKPEDDEVELTFHRDDMGTELRRFYGKYTKHLKDQKK